MQVSEATQRRSNELSAKATKLKDTDIPSSLESIRIAFPQPLLLLQTALQQAQYSPKEETNE